jgi:hypothetical protein
MQIIQNLVLIVLPPEIIIAMDLMMIKINGISLVEHDFDIAAKISLSTAATAHPRAQLPRIMFTSHTCKLRQYR